MAAIETKTKPDAQAAFYLLRDDVLRMRNNTLAVQASLAQLYRASGRQRGLGRGACITLALKLDYGRP
jgi:hypothetical protein